LLETRGVIGSHAVEHVNVRFTAADGTSLAASFLPGPTADAPAVVLAHGFAANRRKPAYARLADRLAERLNVLTIDLRSHGQSDGVCTLGDLEALDVAAGVAWLRDHDHPWVAAAGVSMGGTSVMHAAAAGVVLDAVIAVSTPGWLVQRTSGPMAALHDVWVRPWKRQGLRLVTGVGVVPPSAWRTPVHPVDAAALVDSPMLVIHGDDDIYFPVAEAVAIHAAAFAHSGNATLWRLPIFGHAEDGLSDAFGRALGDAIATAAETGRFPDRP